MQKAMTVVFKGWAIRDSNVGGPRLQERNFAHLTFRFLAGPQIPRWIASCLERQARPCVERIHLLVRAQLIPGQKSATCLLMGSLECVVNIGRRIFPCRVNGDECGLVVCILLFGDLSNYCNSISTIAYDLSEQ